MLGVDHRLTHAFGFLMRQAQHPASTLGKTFHPRQGNILLYLQ